MTVERSRSFIDLAPMSLRLFNIFILLSLEIAEPTETKFHVEPPWDERTKVFSNGPGQWIWPPCSYMIKKTLKTSSLEPKGRLKVGMQYRVFEYYQVRSNDAPVLTFNYFTARSNLVLVLLYGEKVKQWIFQNFLYSFRKIHFLTFNIVVYDIKVDRCSQLNEYVKLYEYQRSRSFTDLGPNLSDSIF